MPLQFSNCAEHIFFFFPLQGVRAPSEGCAGQNAAGQKRCFGGRVCRDRVGKGQRGGRTEINVKNNESFSVQVLKFFDSADIVEHSWFPVPLSLPSHQARVSGTLFHCSFPRRGCAQRREEIEGKTNKQTKPQKTKIEGRAKVSYSG